MTTVVRLICSRNNHHKIAIRSSTSFLLRRRTRTRTTTTTILAPSSSSSSSTLWNTHRQPLFTGSRTTQVRLFSTNNNNNNNNDDDLNSKSPKATTSTTTTTTTTTTPPTNETEESKTQELSRHWIEQLQSPPNIITSLRILSIPYLSYLIVWTHQYEWALYGACLAGASDVLDGYLARRFDQTTVLGSFLDPLADKLLLNVLAVSLCHVQILPVPQLVGLWVTRDIGLLVGTYYSVSKRTHPDADFIMDPSTTPLQVSATSISKLNTSLQFLTVWLALLQPVYDGPSPFLLEACCWITGGTTIASAVSYIGHDAFSDSGNTTKQRRPKV